MIEPPTPPKEKCFGDAAGWQKANQPNSKPTPMSNDLDANILGKDLFGDTIKRTAKAPIADRFLIPPFSVLNAREGVWQERKRAWLALGIESEIGRGSSATWGISPSGTETGDNSGAAYTDGAKRLLNASPGGSPRPACDYSKRERGTGSGKPIAGTAAAGGSGVKMAMHNDPMQRKAKYDSQ